MLVLVLMHRSWAFFRDQEGIQETKWEIDSKTIDCLRSREIKVSYKDMQILEWNVFF